MNGQHFDVKDLEREFVRGKRLGAIEQLRNELEHFKEKSSSANDMLYQISKIHPKPHLTQAFQAWSNYESEISRIEKRIKELEAEGKQNGKKA